METAALRKKIGQTFVIGFQGQTITDDLKKFIVDESIGGVILFDRNIKSPAELATLNNELQNLVVGRSGSLPLFISIDMEGGRVARLKAPFTQWPPMKILGEIGSAALSFKFAETMGKELLSVGINMNYSPCADILTNEKNTVIGDRAFGTEPEIVSKMASAIVRGFLKSGVIPCVKHFPGHGDTLIDSHDDLPVVTHDLKRLDETEFVPFKKCFRARANLLMTAHLKLEKVDPENPATFSRIVLEDILRKQLGYRGVIMTDDMEMKAITKNYGVEDGAIRAVLAGCNILLYCHTLDVQKKALEAVVKAVVDKKIPVELIERNLQTVLRLKKDSFSPEYKPVDVAAVTQNIGHPDHLKLSKQIARKELPAGIST